MGTAHACGRDTLVIVQVAFAFGHHFRVAGFELLGPRR
jgi:hypothetical protein